MSETDLVKACTHFLTLKGIFHYRNNTGALKSGDRFIRFGAKGSPYIVAVRDGRYIGIECKAPNGRQSPDQKAFEQALTEAGGTYLIVHEVTDLTYIF